jgi:hypothetical protein
MSDPTIQPEPVSTVAEFEFPNITGKVQFDCAAIPANVRLDFLKGAVRAYIANRLNAANTRHTKDDTVASWAAYDAATKADALQTIVPRPTVERPAEPNYMEVYNRAVADLATGTVRRQGTEPKIRKTKDPLISLVTDAVVRAIYNTNRAANAKYTFFDARKEVGVDGVAYLHAMIEEKVKGGVDRASLEASLEEKYMGPARRMLGQESSKKGAALPSIL